MNEYGRSRFVAPWLHDAQLAESVYGGREVYGGKGVAALTTVGRRAAERYQARPNPGYRARREHHGPSRGHVLA